MKLEEAPVRRINAPEQFAEDPRSCYLNNYRELTRKREQMRVQKNSILAQRKSIFDWCLQFNREGLLGTLHDLQLGMYDTAR